MSKAEEILKDSIDINDLVHTGYEIVFKKECVLRAMEAYHQNRLNAISDEPQNLDKGCVVFMKASSGMQGYGNAQCVSGYNRELCEISLYGHNQCYKVDFVERIISFPNPNLKKLLKQ